ncbi:hypothetical protein QSJ19_25290 [Gordonia sp. ABSL11-1]|nr:hypothetical protein [Gordonia sp. ABSL11-1]MDL9948834.1 hypothetical protein [Gordonia sp. ABSL11-1]
MNSITHADVAAPITSPGSPTYRRRRTFDPVTKKWQWVWAQTS